MPSQVLAFNQKTAYPKIANYFLTSNQNFDWHKLSRYNLVILPIDTQIYNYAFFAYARQKNPDIIILAYTPAQSVNISTLSDIRSFNYKLNNQIQASWWLRDSQGNIISTWPGIKNINVTTLWPEWFPCFVKNEVLDTGLWDGIFYDMVDSEISWANKGDIDLNNDHKKDNPTWANSEWQKGIVKLLKKSRQVFGGNKIIVINGSSVKDYQPYINGRMFEDFPTPWQGTGKWRDSMDALKRNANQVGYANFFIINSLGNQNDFKKVRFGLTSSLLADAYFSYNNSIQRHEALWWYDEYDINLGSPLGQAQDALNTKSVQYQPGVWRRDFTNGIALVNSTCKSQTIDLGGGVYEKIRGTQDPITNNGQLVRKVTLSAEDGIILLKKIEELKKVGFDNGSFVRIFDKRGRVKRTGFYAYQPSFEGGVQIVIDDLDGDGQDETLVADKTQIKIFKENGVLVNSFYPYGKHYNHGINIAVGNVIGNAKKEIVTGTKPGGGPYIRIFDYQGKLIHPGWFAYDKNFRGGVNVALGDLDGNGYKEIVAGAGFGGGPHIRIFNAKGYLFDPGFFSYDRNFRGGVNVACADLNNDGKDEIITGAGPSGGPHIRIFDKIGHLIDPGFFAFNPTKRDGVRIGAVDIDNDGEVEILGMN